LQWLELLPAEHNTITRTWAQLGETIKDAARSQALIQLKTHYCDKHRCTDCQIGHAVIAEPPVLWERAYSSPAGMPAT